MSEKEKEVINSEDVGSLEDVISPEMKSQKEVLKKVETDDRLQVLTSANAESGFFSSSDDIQVVVGGKFEKEGKVSSAFISFESKPALSDCIFIPGMSEVDKLGILNDWHRLIGVAGKDMEGKLCVQFIKFSTDKLNEYEIFKAETDPKLNRVSCILSFTAASTILLLGVNRLENDSEFPTIDRLIFDEANAKFVSSDSKTLINQDSGMPIPGLFVSGIAYEDSLFIGGGIFTDNKVAGMIVKLDTNFEPQNNMFFSAVDIPSIVVQDMKMAIQNGRTVIIASCIARNGDKVGLITKVVDLDLNEINVIKGENDESSQDPVTSENETPIQ